MRMLAIVVIVVALMGSVGVGAQEATPVGSPVAQTTATFTSESRQVGPHEWTIDITNVLTAGRVGDISGSDEDTISVARGTYVIVNMTILNLGKKEDEFPFDELKVVDSQDREFSYDFGATYQYCYSNLDEQIMSRLQPSLPYDWGIVFDVALDSDGLTLTNETHTFSIPLNSRR